MIETLTPFREGIVGILNRGNALNTFHDADRKFDGALMLSKTIEETM